MGAGNAASWSGRPASWLASYDKVHLFDASVRAMRSTDSVEGCDEAVTVGVGGGLGDNDDGGRGVVVGPGRPATTCGSRAVRDAGFGCRGQRVAVSRGDRAGKVEHRGAVQTRPARPTARDLRRGRSGRPIRRRSRRGWRGPLGDAETEREVIGRRGERASPTRVGHSSAASRSPLAASSQSSGAGARSPRRFDPTWTRSPTGAHPAGAGERVLRGGGPPRGADAALPRGRRSAGGLTLHLLVGCRSAGLRWGHDSVPEPPSVVVVITGGRVVPVVGELIEGRHGARSATAWSRRSAGRRRRVPAGARAVTPTAAGVCPASVEAHGDVGISEEGERARRQ